MTRRGVGTMIATLVVGGFLLVFLVFPVIEVLRGGLFDDQGRFTLAYVLEIFRNRLYIEGLRNSLFVAAATTLLTLFLAVPLAWLYDRFDFPGKGWLSALILVPMILPPFVGALGMEKILGPGGALAVFLEKIGLCAPGAVPDLLGAGGLWGVIIVEALHLYPVLYLNVVAAFANIDPAMYEAAADLGCTGFSRFRRIALPLVMPGVFAGGAIVCVWSFTELGTPLMFNVARMTPVQIFDGLKEIGANPFPYALVIVLLAASALIYLPARLTVGRQAWAMTAKAGRAAARRRLRGVHGVAAAACFAVVILLAALPHIGLIGMSLSRCWYRTVLPHGLTVEHFQAALGHNLTVPSILNSMRYASLAVVAGMLIGVTVAWLNVRARSRAGWILDLLAMMPLAVPGLVLAFGYLVMTQKGRLLHALDPVENPTVLLVIAYAIRRLPYIVRAATAGLEQVSTSLEEAAADVGAGPLTVLRRITLPLIAANLIAGALLAFSFAMLEVSDSLVLAQKSMFFPITKAIYELSMLLGEGRPLACALGVWTMAFLAASIFAASRLLGAKMGRLFRV